MTDRQTDRRSGECSVRISHLFALLIYSDTLIIVIMLLTKVVHHSYTVYYTCTHTHTRLYNHESVICLDSGYRVLALQWCQRLNFAGNLLVNYQHRPYVIDNFLISVIIIHQTSQTNGWTDSLRQEYCTVQNEFWHITIAENCIHCIACSPKFPSICHRL